MNDWVKAWRELALGPEGEELRAAFEAAEDDELHRKAELDKKVSAAMKRLAKKVKRTPRIAEQQNVPEDMVPVGAVRMGGMGAFLDPSGSHVIFMCSLPLPVANELMHEWMAYCDHHCAEAEDVLMRFLAKVMERIWNVTPPLPCDHPDEEEEDDEE